MNETSKPRRRSNGEGSIYKTTEGRWRGAASYIDEDGTLKRKVVSGATQADVRRKLADLKGALDRGEATTGSTSLSAYAATWLERERLRVRPGTWVARKQHLDSYILPSLGRLRLDRIAVADVDGLTSRLLAKGLSPRTVAGARITLRKVLGDAVRDGLLHRNVAALSRPPRVETSEAKYLDSTQLRTLLEVAKTDDLIGPQVIISATTGIRQGELLGLDWADVDLTGRTLTVRQQLGRAVDGSRVLAPTKTQRSRRTIALPQVAVDALTALYEAQDGPVAPQGLIFRHPLGQPVDGVHMNHRFHRLLERAGLPDMGWHGLRHSAATALLTAGVPLDVVSRTLGHSSVAVTSDVYGHLVVERQQTAASAMDRVLLGG